MIKIKVLSIALTFLLTIGIGHVYGTDFEKYGWSNREIKTANTGINADFLSANEKEVMLVMNLCRLYPQRFLRLMEKMWTGESTNSYAFETDFNSSYYKSLQKDLKKQTPLVALVPNRDLSKTAEKHAMDMGKTGNTGHNSSKGVGFSKRMKKYLDQYLRVGENCSYGYDNGVDIVMQLLVDNQVKSLGHRKNILSAGFSSAGISIYTHKKYSFNCVIDYSGKP